MSAGKHVDICDEIETLARRVERLTISRQDPEAFFCERSEIAADLRAAAGRAAWVLPDKKNARVPHSRKIASGWAFRS